MRAEATPFAGAFRIVWAGCILILAAGWGLGDPRASQEKPNQRTSAMTEVRFMTLDPGHFHAGLVQKEMYSGVSSRVDVYAPLGSDLIEHLNRIIAFNSRSQRPTAWQLEVHTGPDFMERMLRERPGNVVVLSGRNRDKIDRIKASVETGLNVLSDKPWIIEPQDLPKLEAALETAERKGLVAYDIMTERYEVTSMIQKELVNDRATFGGMIPGSEKEPGVYMESIHYLLKLVAGLPNRRPVWFFDVHQQGEALPDVGTHLVDLVQWILFPEQAIVYRKDIQVVAGKRWPTVLSKADFQKVTGAADYPAFLLPYVKNESLQYYCNTQVSYILRGIHVKLDVLWNYEAATGGDTHFAVFRGSRSRVEIRQGEPEKYRPEVYVVPNTAADKAEVGAALRAKVGVLGGKFPGVSVQDLGKEFIVTVPDVFRNGHEAHFAEVTNKFLAYLKNPKSVPAWERPNMAAKYYVTTQGLELSRRQSAGR